MGVREYSNAAKESDVRDSPLYLIIFVLYTPSQNIFKPLNGSELFQ